jgi:hypothetical protein
MSSDSGSQNPFPGLSNANAFVRVYFDAWQSYFNTLNGIWGDVTAPDAKLGAWASGWSRLAQAWANGAADVYDACMRPGRRQIDEPVVTFVVDAAMQATNPRSVPVPFGVDAARVDRTDLRAVGAGERGDIDKQFLQVTADPGGRSVSLGLGDLRRLDLDPGLKSGSYVAIVHEGARDGDPNPVPRRPIAVVVVTFV